MAQPLIVAAKRTPQGKFLGGLARQSPTDLAKAAGEAAMQSLGDHPAQHVDQVIVGHVIAAGQGMNVARQVGVGLDLPITTPAFSVNMMCASGMQAVMLGAQAIRAGQAEVVLCGGTESMSNAPHLLERARKGYKLGDGVLVDSLLRDGLVDSFDHQHMGQTAERLANDYAISRQAQDAFAAQSQQRYGKAATSRGLTDELVAVGDVEQDEHPRPETHAQALGELKPVFDAQGSVTAGNASGINDGAAMLVLCDPASAERHGWSPLAGLSDAAAVGCDPKRMGLGPVHATRRLCESSGCTLDDFDSIEINEAYAAQVLACCHELNLASEDSRLNPHGGAIALGHPIGASGARLITHLAHQIHRGEVHRGLATLCVGGGMGAAVSLESAKGIQG